MLVGNDTVLGHVQTTSGVSTAPGAYPINRQTAYANANDLLSGLDKPRELDSAIGVYIDKGSVARNINVSADMDIDRFSYGIVMAEKNGGPATNVTIGDGAYTLDASGKVNSLTATDAPTELQEDRLSQQPHQTLKFQKKLRSREMQCTTIQQTQHQEVSHGQT